MRFEFEREDRAMRSIKFGYKIEDGKMMIHEEEAEKIRKVFECYLSGMTMVDIGKTLGISKFHGTVRGILKCKHYLGNGIYPKIIDEDIF